MSNNTSIISPPPFEYFGGTANMSRASSSEHPGTNSFNSTASGDDCTLLETIENVQSNPDAAGDTGDGSSPQGPDGNEDMSPLDLIDAQIDAMNARIDARLQGISNPNGGSWGDVTNNPGSGNTPGEDISDLNNFWESSFGSDLVLGNLNRESTLLDDVFQGDGTGGIDLSKTDLKVYGDVKVKGPLSTQFYGQFGFQNGESTVGVSTQLNLDVLECESYDVKFVSVLDVNTYGSERGAGLAWWWKDVETKEKTTEIKVMAYTSDNEFVNGGDRDSGYRMDINQKLNNNLKVMTTVSVDAEGNLQVNSGVGLSF